MASLHDVARLAGVSKSTVSRVINDEYGVKEATKVKVRRAIEECGYVVNQVAKDLKSNKTNLIGIIVPRVASNATSQGCRWVERRYSNKQENTFCWPIAAWRLARNCNTSSCSTKSVLKVS